MHASNLKFVSDLQSVVIDGGNSSKRFYTGDSLENIHLIRGGAQRNQFDFI